MSDTNLNPNFLLKKEKDYQIGNYLIKKTLGQGTFGKVKLGIYIPTNEKYAIKILEKNKIIEKDDEERVQREFKMLQEFNHPNVILVAEIFETIDRYYTVMDFCEGGELFNYIVKKRRLNEEESSFFYYQIIKGLEYIHSLGIVHRDLKPENLLLTKNHILKIIDFGLSNFYNKHSKLLKTPCGSPCYASPEMVSGNKYNGFKIDIWATGIILFAMLCGYLPFEDKDNDILFKKIKECKIDFPHHLTNISKDLMKKILVTNPERRISINEIKKHPFYLI
jgi:5'-AMP-activated protein kinase catalytic alpha subunit